MVSLTGDVATGKEIARTAADTLKRVHLELGGKAPVLVFDDADPAAVAEAIKIAGYWNSGQDCTAASRVVAGPKIYDKLLEELVPAVESLHVGDPAEGDEIEMGPVISKAQQERVLGFLDARRRARRCSPAAGTNGDRGFFVEPTVVTDVGQDGRDRPARGLRPGRHRAALRRRRRGDRVGQRRRLRPRRVGLDARRRPRAERRARSSSSARSGSTTTSRSCRRCRTAATSSPATARTFDVLARGLHADQARDGEARLNVFPASATTRVSPSGCI